MPDRTQRSGFVLTMNRDELRTREEAAPYAGSRDGVSAVYPIDSIAGGTWVGVNDHGVCMALLNRYQSPSIEGARSRGNIIPEAIHQGGLEECLDFLNSLTLQQYNPFDLLIVGLDEIWQLSWDRREAQWQLLPSDQAIMLTSSSERLPVVSAYRQQLFRDWLQRADDVDEAEAFHRFQAVGREADAVYMSRAKVHSKSLVQVRLNDQGARLFYCDEAALSGGVALQHSQTFSLSVEESLQEALV